MVKLRLTRIGRKKQPYYRIIAVDSRKKRDGAFLDRIGYYHPLEDPAGLKIDADKALKWLRVGAQPSYTVRSLLRRQGVWYRFLLEKRKLPEAQIETMVWEWMKSHTVSAPEESAPATEEEVATPEVEASPEKPPKPKPEAKTEVAEKAAETKPEVKSEVVEKAAESAPEVKAEVVEEKVKDATEPTTKAKGDEPKE